MVAAEKGTPLSRETRGGDLRHAQVTMSGTCGIFDAQPENFMNLLLHSTTNAFSILCTMIATLFRDLPPLVALVRNTTFREVPLPGANRLRSDTALKNRLFSVRRLPDIA